MNYKYLILYYGILSSLSCTIIKPKLCVDCKFFKGNFLYGNTFGKCLMFPREDLDYDETNYLVDGIKRNKRVDYSYCSTSRKYESMCGKEGKMFEKK